jgi:hypothetical protein
MNDFYIKKAKKYKYKYLKLKEELYGGNTCKYNISKERDESNCDRIIYKTNSKINFIEYNVIDIENFEILKLSDHKMIYGIFKYNNQKYMVLSWNMNSFDRKFKSNEKEYIEKNIIIFIDNFLKTKEFDYLIFSFQESIKESFFIETLKKMITKHLKINCVSHVLSNPNLTSMTTSGFYYVHSLVFSKINKKIDDSGSSNLKTTYETQLNFKQYIRQYIKNYLGTKSYVYIKIDDLIIVSTHFPIDSSNIKDLGNELRISALEEINNKFKNDDNVVIIGDLNFRKIDNKDQLNELLMNMPQYTEYKTLETPTCKYNQCKLKCDNESCSLTNKL